MRLTRAGRTFTSDLYLGPLPRSLPQTLAEGLSRPRPVVVREHSMARVCPREKAPARHGRPCRAVALVAFAAVTFGAQQGARAQSDAQQKAAAEALFEEGKQLLSQGQYESACHRFEQSEDIDRGVGTLLYLADCYEKSGKLASAWAIFREASSAASAQGQGERARMADERARKLAPSLSKLVVLVPQEDRIAGVEILLDGKPLSAALYGVPFPIDAGPRELTARAPGRAPWSSIVDIKPNDYRSQQVPVLGSDVAPMPAPVPMPVPAPASVPAAPADVPATVAPELTREPPAVMNAQPHAAPARPAPRIDHSLSYIVGGAGVVGIGLGIGFGVRAADKDSASKPACPSGCVTRAAAEQNRSARTSAVIANVSYGLGAAALVTGVVLYFTTGSNAESNHTATGLALAPSVGADSSGLSLSGRF